MVGAAIASAVQVEGTITHTPATIRGVHRMAGIRHTIGHRFPANLHITEGSHQTMADRQTTVADPQITVANPRTMAEGRLVAEVEVGAGLRAVATEAVASLPAEAEVNTNRLLVSKT